MCVSVFEGSWGLEELKEALRGFHYQNEAPVKNQGQMMLSESAGTWSPKSELKKSGEQR